ncbi:MAG: hypothetical protein MJZ13_06425 [Bacteroidales bacterium]|nr:hypothetical protein [Bacteroidales bacterium]
MDILNAAWLAEIHRLCKGRISSLKTGLETARNEPERELTEIADGYTWKNHMGTTKYYSASGMKALEDFVELYDNGLFKNSDWEKQITHDMWCEFALSLYYGNVKTVYAGISFPDVRDYIFMKMLEK